MRALLDNAGQRTLTTRSVVMAFAVLLSLIPLCTAFLVWPYAVDNSSTMTRCEFEPSTVNGQPAFGLYRAALCPSSQSLVSYVADPITIGGEAPEVARLLGGNGTVIARNGDDSISFRGIGGSAADISVPINSRDGGWSIVAFVKLNNNSVGPVAFLYDDGGGDVDESWFRTCDWRSAVGNSSCLLPSLYVAVAANGETSQILVTAPNLGHSGDTLSFFVPALFDDAWHVLGVTFEPLAAAHFVRVALHLDGTDPIHAGWEQCRRLGAVPGRKALADEGTPWNTTAGALVVGGAIGSLHAVLLYGSALSRQSIAALGTGVTRATASGGSAGDLLALGFVWIGVAVALGAWAVAHAFFEAGLFNLYEFCIRHLDCRTGSDADGVELATSESVPAKNSEANNADAATLATKAASAGIAYAGQMASTSAAAIGSLRAAVLPVATSSSALLVAVSSITLEVPQQMSVLLSNMAFPSVFRRVFGNLFDMVSVRFDFPEVTVPPYAPLIVILVGMIVAGIAVVWQSVDDRKQFVLGVRNWKDRVAAYRILVRHILEGVVNESHDDFTEQEKESIVTSVVTALVAEFPLPAGCFTPEFFAHAIGAQAPDPKSATLAAAMHSRCFHLLDVMPTDTVTMLCMCLIPQAKSSVVSASEAAALAVKLQSLAKSFDRKWADAICPIAVEADARGAENDNREEFVRCLIEEWSSPSTVCDFASVIQKLIGSECFRHQPWLEAAATCDALSESRLVDHVAAFVRAVLTWVIEPNDDNMETFAKPFFEFHAARSREDGVEPPPPPVAVVEGSGSLASKTSKKPVKRGFLKQNSRQAATLYRTMCQDEQRFAGDKTPPYNRSVPERQYFWIGDALGVAPLSAHKVKLRMMMENEDRKKPLPQEPQTSAIEEGPRDAPEQSSIEEIRRRRAVPSGAAHCCPLHVNVTVVRASETHLSSQTLDGRPMYRCCNTDLDLLKEALHGNEHCTGDACDDGEIFMCPWKTCGFAICGRCLRRETSTLYMLRVHGAGLIHTLRTLNPPLTATLSVVLLEALLFPVTQIPLLVLTCSSTVSCWLGGCYSAWTAEFTVSFCLSIVLVVLRASAAVWLSAELRRRQVVCEEVLMTCGTSAPSLSVRNERWGYFVENCDRSLLRSMYVSTELSFVTSGPVVKLAFDAVLILSVCLTPADSVAQKCAVGVVYVARGIYLSLANPNLVLWLDVLMKAVVVHQLLILGLSTAALGEVVGGASRDASVFAAAMILVTVVFFLLVVVVIARVLITPLMTVLWNDSMSALSRRDAQASMLSHDSDSLRKKMDMLKETLELKQQLCSTLWDNVNAGFSRLVTSCGGEAISLRTPHARGGSQIAVTAAMILQTSQQMKQQRSDKEELPTSYRELIEYSQALTSRWLAAVAGMGFFHDPDPSVYSLSTRQLLSFESEALGFVLQQLCDRSDDTEGRNIRGCWALASPIGGPMTHCNQLQVLSAAKLTSGLTFVRCNLRGCRLIRGTRLWRSNFCGSDLSFTNMRECSMVSCNLHQAIVASRQFVPSVPSLSCVIDDPYRSNFITGVAVSHDLIACSAESSVIFWDATTGERRHSLWGKSFPKITCVAISPDGTRVITGCDERYVRLWDLKSGTEISVITRHGNDVTSVAFSPDGTKVVSGSKDITARLSDAESGRQLSKFQHRDIVNSVAFSPDGLRVVSGSNDMTALVWSATDYTTKYLKPVLELKAHTREVTCVAYSNDNVRLASASLDKTVRVWDAHSGAELRVLQHTSCVGCVAFSPNGSLLASGDYDHFVNLWDPVSGEALTNFVGHTNAVECIAFYPDSSRLVSGNHNTIRVWNVLTSEPRCSMGHTGAVNSVACSPTSECIASGSDDMTIRVWDTATYCNELCILRGHADAVTSVAFSPDGERIVSGSKDNSVRVWSLREGGEQSLVLEGHTDCVKSVCFSVDGHFVASGSDDETIRLWDAADGKEVRVLTGHKYGVTSVVFSPDGSQIASGSPDESVRVWDSSSGDPLLILTGHRKTVNCVVYSPNGYYIASCSDDQSVRVWDATAGDLLLHIKDLGHEAASISFAPDGARLAIGTHGFRVVVYDVISSTELLCFESHDNNVLSVCFSPDGARIVSGSADKTMRVWNAASGTAFRALRGTRPRNASNRSVAVSSIAVSVDGTLIVGGSSESTVHLWDRESGEEQMLMKGHSKSVNCVGFSPDGKRVVSASSDCTIRVWDATSGEAILVVTCHSKYVYCVAYSPDGLRCVSGSADATVCVWDATDGAVVLRYDRHVREVNCARYSPDGTRIASGGFDSLVHVWDATSGVQLVALTGHTSSVVAIAYSPDGSLIGSGSYDHSLRLWDAGSGAELHAIGHSDSVHGVAFSPDGTSVASGCFDNTIRLWEVVTGKLLQELVGQSESTAAVAFPPDGEVLFSGSSDNTIKVWNLTECASIRPLVGHAGDVEHVAFAPDGSLIATVSRDKMVRVWTKDCQAACVFEGHTDAVTCVDFAADGVVVSGSVDCSLRLWDVSLGTELSVLLGHSGPIACLAAFPLTKRIVSGDGDSAIRIWDASSEGGWEVCGVLRGHAGAITNVAFSPDGVHIVSACFADKTVCLWDGSSATLLLALPICNSFVTSPRSRVFCSPGGTRGCVIKGAVVFCRRFACRSCELDNEKHQLAPVHDVIAMIGPSKFALQGVTM